MKCNVEICRWDNGMEEIKVKKRNYEFECENEKEGLIKSFGYLYGGESKKEILEILSMINVEEKDLEDKNFIEKKLEDDIYNVYLEDVISKLKIEDKIYIDENIKDIIKELIDEVIYIEEVEM